MNKQRAAPVADAALVDRAQAATAANKSVCRCALAARALGRDGRA
jgi:hypothetical protein